MWLISEGLDQEQRIEALHLPLTRLSEGCDGLTPAATHSLLPGGMERAGKRWSLWAEMSLSLPAQQGMTASWHRTRLKPAWTPQTREQNLKADTFGFLTTETPELIQKAPN